MKRMSTAVLVGVAGVAFVLGQAVRPSSAVAHVQPEGAEAMDPSMAAMREAGTPGEHHRYLDLMLGTWGGTMSWTPNPGDEAMEFEVHATREWVLDGRYVREVVTSEFGGMPFEGIGYTGYSNIDQQFETVWMDSMSTWIYPGRGNYNPATKVLTIHSQQRDPETGRMITCWSEVDMSDSDRHVMKGWCYAADGSTFQNVEGVFERR